MSANHFSWVGGVAAAALLAASPVGAQTTSYSDVPDRFRVEAGGFRIGADTELSFNSPSNGSGRVNFEDLAVPNSTTRFYVEGFWRPWRRHQFSLSYFRNARDGENKTVDRDFTWGDRVITAGATVRGKVSSGYLSGAYRFAAYKNDRFEIGPSIGIGHLSLEAGISGDASISASGGSTSAPFDVSRRTGHPTGDIGAYFYWWPARRLLLRGHLRYILVKPENAEASVTDGQAAAIYHPWRNVGVGLQFNYTKFRYDRDIISRDLGGSLRYSGGQVVVSAAF